MVRIVQSVYLDYKETLEDMIGAGEPSLVFICIRRFEPPTYAGSAKMNCNLSEHSDQNYAFCDKDLLGQFRQLC